jgi:hypothetical protein
MADIPVPCSSGRGIMGDTTQGILVMAGGRGFIRMDFMDTLRPDLAMPGPETLAARSTVARPSPAAADFSPTIDSE